MPTPSKAIKPRALRQPTISTNKLMGNPPALAPRVPRNKVSPIKIESLCGGNHIVATLTQLKKANADPTPVQKRPIEAINKLSALANNPVPKLHTRAADIKSRRGPN